MSVSQKITGIFQNAGDVTGRNNCNRFFPCNICKEIDHKTSKPAFCHRDSEDGKITRKYQTNGEIDPSPSDKCNRCIIQKKTCSGEPCLRCIQYSKYRFDSTSLQCIFNRGNGLFETFSLKDAYTTEDGFPAYHDHDKAIVYPNPHPVFNINTDFPYGFTTINTPADNYECGLHAIVLSFYAQLPIDWVQPTVNALKFQRRRPEYITLNTDNDGNSITTNNNEFNINQLTNMLWIWGKQHNYNLQLVTIGPTNGTIVLETTDNVNRTTVWIHNDDFEDQKISTNEPSRQISHWEGMAPKDAPSPKKKKSKTLPSRPKKPPPPPPSDDEDSSQPPLDDDLIPGEPKKKKRKFKTTTTGSHIDSQVAFMLHPEEAYAPLPKSYFIAINGPEGPEWKKAFESEINSLISKGTWETVKLPTGRRALTSKWVLKRKIGPDGKVKRYKARLVARGFQQREGIDFTEIFATVMKPTTWRILLALACHYNWKSYQFDVITAFLNGDLDEEIYMRAPPGYPCADGEVLLLKKALYGLKQASRSWYTKFKEEMTKLGWIASMYDPCLFIWKQGKSRMFLVIYVDDIYLFTDSDKNATTFRDQLFEVFDMTDDDDKSYFLGMNIEWSTDGVKIHQRNAIEQMIRKHNLDKIPTVVTPITTVLPANTEAKPSPDFITRYLSEVGSLIYPAQMSRPDISFAVSVSGRFSSNPNQHHVDAEHRIYAYLKGSKEQGLVCKKSTPLIIEGYVDSDHGGCPTTFRSTTGWCFLLKKFCISWCSQRQKTVSTSTTEAEYVAAAEAAREAAWLKGIINELEINFHVDTIPLYIDNNSALKLTRNAEYHSRSKHINIKYHYIRQAVEEGIIDPQRVDTTENIADIFTKGIRSPLMNKHLKAAGIE
jgi:hypothetical protein